MQCDSGVGVGVPGLNQDPIRSGYFAIRVRCFPPVLILRCDRVGRVRKGQIDRPKVEWHV